MDKSDDFIIFCTNLVRCYMNILSRNILILMLLFFVKLFSQSTEQKNYSGIRSQFENLNKNDIRALPFVNDYIREAKRDLNYEELTQAYRDAVFYTPHARDKLIYSDSMIYAAEKSRDNSLLTLAYLGKGIIYYFNYKKYEPALDQYLKAYEYSTKTNDKYLKYKVIYHLGVVKSYLGYYKDAIVHFNGCINFFECEGEKSSNNNEIYNYKRGYYNSLHQMIICHRNIGNLKTVDSLINIGISKINREKDFSLERSYLLKCRGISELSHHKYDNAIIDLESSLPELISKDFSWASVAYFYLGKSYMINDEKKGLMQMEKVDSIFNRHRFILPELRKNYEILIKHYRKKKNVGKELYYTNQLLAVDSVITKNFTYLSPRIHKEYDTKALLKKKEYLENKSRSRLLMIIFLSMMATFFIALFVQRYKREKAILLKYQKLQEKLNGDAIGAIVIEKVVENERKSVLSPEVCKDLTEKIIKFESRRGFVQQGLTIAGLASQIDTNTSYLSIYINEYKGSNFKNYLNKLRINYITELLNSNKKFLFYTNEALAEECGIATRQSFSDLFYEINGIRPQDYIRKRKQDQELL